MRDRRSVDRLQVDVHLDDLQSEMEAGARALDKIRADVASLEELLRSELRIADITGSLVRQVRQLASSVRLQRVTLGELRIEMRKLRAQAERARHEAAALRTDQRPRP
jgi:hypothetical protein